MLEEEFLLDHHLKTLKFLVRCGGMCLESRKRKYSNKVRDLSVYLLNFLWLNTDLIGAIYWFVDGMISGKSIVSLTYIAPCITLSFMANFKGYFFVRYEDDVNELIDSLKNLEIKENSTKGRNKDVVKILRKETKFLAIVIKMSNILNVFLLVTFAISPLILIAYKYIKTNEVELILPFLIVYPFDSHDIRIWPFVYLRQIWSECVVIINICISDYMFYVCCTFLRIQFRLLQHRLENIIATDYSIETILSNLVEIIKRHQMLIRLADVLEKLYTKSTLYNFLSSSVLICLTGFNVMVIEDVAFAITYLVFLSTSLLQIFLLCFFGDKLMQSSTEVGDTVYKSKWYQTKPCISRNLLLIQIRAQKPCKLTASNFADVNLRAFMKILSTAWSYFALLKTMYSVRG